MSYILILKKIDYSTGLIHTIVYSLGFFQNNYENVTPWTLAIRWGVLDLNLYFFFLPSSPNASKNRGLFYLEIYIYIYIYIHITFYLEIFHTCEYMYICIFRLLSASPFWKLSSQWKHVLLLTKLLFVLICFLLSFQ